jgi:hypothetical protein
MKPTKEKSALFKIFIDQRKSCGCGDFFGWKQEDRQENQE